MQADRLAARRTVVTKRASGGERARLVRRLAARVRTALASRDAAVTRYELSAGRALVQMVEGEGLTVREAVAACGDDLSVAEASRLRGLAKSETSFSAGP